MERSFSVATLLPAYVIAEHATLARLDVGFASADVVLHANGLVIAPKLDGAVIWHLNLPSSLSFSLLLTLAFASISFG